MKKLILTEVEQAMLAGEHGPAIAMCMRLIVGVAKGEGRKVDLAAVDHLFIHNVDARHGVAAGPVFDGQPAENELGRRGADIDAHAEDHFMQLASPAS